MRQRHYLGRTYRSPDGKRVRPIAHQAKIQLLVDQSCSAYLIDAAGRLQFACQQGKLSLAQSETPGEAPYPKRARAVPKHNMTCEAVLEIEIGGGGQGGKQFLCIPARSRTTITQRHRTRNRISRACVCQLR